MDYWSPVIWNGWHRSDDFSSGKPYSTHNYKLAVTKTCIIHRYAGGKSQSPEWTSTHYLLVNAFVILTWLPDCVVSVYWSLLTSRTINVSKETYALVHQLHIYLFLGTYLNGGINGLVYILRLRRLRIFYYDIFSQLCQRDDLRPNHCNSVEMGHVNDTVHP